MASSVAQKGRSSRTTGSRRNQAALRGRRLPNLLHLVPRSVTSAAEQSVGSIRPRLMRGVDLPAALAVLVGAIILALVCFIYLSQITAVSNANYTLQRLQSEHTDLLRERQDLQIQIARVQSLSNIERMAREKLQMVPLGDRYTYVTVPDGPLSAVPPLPTPGLPVPTPEGP